MPRRHINRATDSHCETTKQLEVEVPAMISRNQCAADRIPTQSSEGNDEETCAVPHPNLTNVGDLGYQWRYHWNEGSGREPENGRKDNDWHIALCRDPESQDNNGREEGCHNHDVEPTKPISKVARQDTTEYASRTSAQWSLEKTSVMLFLILENSRSISNTRSVWATFHGLWLRQPRTSAAGISRRKRRSWLLQWDRSEARAVAGQSRTA